MSDVKFIDNSGKVKEEFREQLSKAMEACGLAGEGFAKANLTRFPRVDTGRLRSSVSHVSDDQNAYIGTNVEYAPYVELGTGPYATDGTGRKDVPWFYKDENGKGHLSYGMKPSHFLKNAVVEHKEDYVRIIENCLKGR